MVVARGGTLGDGGTKQPGGAIKNEQARIE